MKEHLRARSLIRGPINDLYTYDHNDKGYTGSNWARVSTWVKLWAPTLTKRCIQQNVVKGVGVECLEAVATPCHIEKIGIKSLLDKNLPQIQRHRKVSLAISKRESHMSLGWQPRKQIESDNIKIHVTSEMTGSKPWG